MSHGHTTRLDAVVSLVWRHTAPRLGAWVCMFWNECRYWAQQRPRVTVFQSASRSRPKIVRGSALPEVSRECVGSYKLHTWKWQFYLYFQNYIHSCYSKWDYVCLHGGRKLDKMGSVKVLGAQPSWPPPPFPRPIDTYHSVSPTIPARFGYVSLWTLTSSLLGDF